MRISPTYLKYAGLLCAVVAAVMAFGALSQGPNDSSHMSPESAIAMAIVAYVFVRASESSPR